MARAVIGAVVLLVALLHASSASAAKRSRSRQRREIESLSGPTDEQVWDSGLMDQRLSYATVIEKGRQFYDDTSVKRFKGFVLGYVTPWNPAGYRHAVTFRKKLDAVAPVWFVVKKTKGVNAPEITGSHEVNETWISELRQDDGAGPLVVPRFIIEGEPEAHVEMLRDPKATLEAMAVHVVGHKLDGMVLETWAFWTSMNGMANEAFVDAAFRFLKALGELLHTNKKKLYLAVPPLYPAGHQAPWLGREHLFELADIVDGFSVMTYDYSATSGPPGPNAPLEWVRMNVRLLQEGPLTERDTGTVGPPLPPGVAPRVLLGVNFYGWDFSASRHGVAAVTANDVVALLGRHQPEIEWVAQHEEHTFAYTDKDGHAHAVWFPTPRALEQRLQIAEENGLGLSIWELGQGLERFFDLL